MGRTSTEEREGTGEDIRRGDEDINHSRKSVVEERLCLLWFKLFSEKCVKSSKVPVRLSSIP